MWPTQVDLFSSFILLFHYIFGNTTWLLYAPNLKKNFGCQGAKGQVTHPKVWPQVSPLEQENLSNSELLFLYCSKSCCCHGDSSGAVASWLVRLVASMWLQCVTAQWWHGDGGKTGTEVAEKITVFFFLLVFLFSWWISHLLVFFALPFYLTQQCY